MSDFYLPWTTGKTLDTYVVSATNQRYRFDTIVFENFNGTNWSHYGKASEYPTNPGAGVGITEQAGSGDYFGTLPTTGITAGTYSIIVRERQSTDPAISDPTVASIAMDYDPAGVGWTDQETTIDEKLVTISGQVGDVQSQVLTLQGTVNTLTADVAAIPAAVNTTLTGAHGSGAWNVAGGGGGGTGTGDILVTHNYGGTDSYRVLDNTSNPVDGATISAFDATAYAAGTNPTPDGQTFTGADGRWEVGLMLDPGTYKLQISKPGVIQDKVVDLVVT